MDLSKLDQAGQRYLGDCVAPSTRAAYGSAVRRYHNFCNRFNIQNPFPLTESILSHFVAFLGQEGLKHRTLKSIYLASDLHKSIKLLAILSSRSACPLLDYVLAGIKQAESRVATHTDPRLPIAFKFLGA